MNFFKYALTFILGAGIGTLVTYKIVEKKYNDQMDKVINEEVEKIREFYKGSSKEKTNDISSDKTDEQKSGNDILEQHETEVSYTKYQPTIEDINKYHDLTSMYENNASANKAPDEVKTAEDYFEKYDIRVIVDEEFGDDPTYNVETVTLYADNVLELGNGEIASKEYIKENIGNIDDIRVLFGAYEPDTVYLRNDDTRFYYEILRDYRRYDNL